MEFKPDNNIMLPEPIEWMKNKSELKLKGNQIHDTFFIKEKQYHPHLKFWEMESSFDFMHYTDKGSCNVVFSFKDYLTKGEKAEFEINISNFNLDKGSEYSARDKNQIKNNLLDLFEARKDETYKKFIQYLDNKRTMA